MGVGVEGWRVWGLGGRVWGCGFREVALTGLGVCGAVEALTQPWKDLKGRSLNGVPIKCHSLV